MSGAQNFFRRGHDSHERSQAMGVAFTGMFFTDTVYTLTLAVAFACRVFVNTRAFKLVVDRFVGAATYAADK